MHTNACSMNSWYNLETTISKTHKASAILTEQINWLLALYLAQAVGSNPFWVMKRLRTFWIKLFVLFGSTSSFCFILLSLYSHSGFTQFLSYVCFLFCRTLFLSFYFFPFTFLFCHQIKTFWMDIYKYILCISCQLSIYVLYTERSYPHPRSLSKRFFY